MAWESTEENLDQAQSVADRDNPRDVRVFIVAFDDVATPAQARTAPKVPRVNDPHNETGNLAATVDPQKREGTRQVYDVVVTYRPISFSGPSENVEQGGSTSDDNEQAKNPRIPRIELHNVQRSKTFREDIHGKPLTNSAGTPRTYQGDDSFTELALRGRVAFPLFQKEFNKTYADSVNSKPLFGYDKHTMKLITVRGRTVLEEEQVKWDVEIVWHIFDTWKAEYLDEGRAEASVEGFEHSTPYDSSGTQASINIKDRKQIVDDLGLPVSEAQLLDGSGQVLEQNSDPVHISKPIYHPKDHSALLRAMKFSTNWDDYGRIKVRQ